MARGDALIAALKTPALEEEVGRGGSHHLSLTCALQSLPSSKYSRREDFLSNSLIDFRRDLQTNTDSHAILRRMQEILEYLGYGRVNTLFPSVTDGQCETP